MSLLPGSEKKEIPQKEKLDAALEAEEKVLTTPMANSFAKFEKLRPG
jgi:hypothetical protein